MFAYQDKQNWVKAAVAEAAVGGDLASHVIGLFSLTIKNNPSVNQRIQERGDLERKPADNEEKKDKENQGSGFFLCLDSSDLLKRAVL